MIANNMTELALIKARQRADSVISTPQMPLIDDELKAHILEHIKKRKIEFTEVYLLGFSDALAEVERIQQEQNKSGL